MKRTLLFFVLCIVPLFAYSQASQEAGVFDLTPTAGSEPSLLIRAKATKPHFKFNATPNLGDENESTLQKEHKVLNFLMGEVMLALVSTPAFAKKGAYWTAATLHVSSLAAFNGGKWAENDQTSLYAFGLINAVALPHYFIQPPSGSRVFWRNFASLQGTVLTIYLIDKAISRKKNANQGTVKS